MSNHTNDRSSAPKASAAQAREEGRVRVDGEATSQGQSVATAEVVEDAPNGRRRRVSIAMFLAVVLMVAAVGAWYYISGLGYEKTDDAFIEANVFEIAPRIAGRLVSVPVSDNQMVETGAVLAEIDAADYQARVDQAQAALDLAKAQQQEAAIQVQITEATTAAGVSQAQAEVAAAQAQVQQEQAALEAAKTDLQRAQADYERYSQLSDKAVSPQRLDVARTTAANAESNVHAAEKRVAWAEAQVTAAQAKQAAAEADRQRVQAAQAEVGRRAAEVKQAEAALREAQLELSYTKIIATASGRITNKAVLSGDYVQPGRTLMAVVSPQVWVVANFKETQLRHMRPGQRAMIHIDAYHIDLPGHVQSIQSGSGAAFSLLPPQNATGNYVKVVQRVPVKIVFDQPPDAARYPLGPGMSAVPRVEVKE